MWLLLTTDDVLGIHDDVLNTGELPGLAADKSLDGALGRIDFRIQYNTIQDEYDLAATYAVVIARAHAFNDGNKRTAFAAMDTCLLINGIVPQWNMAEVGNLIIDVAQGNIDEGQLATWLREHIAAQL